MRRHPALALAALALVAVGLSGCMESTTGQEFRFDRVPPEDLAVPEWSVGDQWAYYRPDDQRWENWTVEAVETVDGYQTYRVQVSQSLADEFGLKESTSWHDISSLGWVSYRDRDGAIQSNPPTSQIFPLVNRTYTPSEETSWGYSENATLRLEVYGWTELAVEGAIYDVVEYATLYHDFDEVIHRGWYSPVAGNIVKMDLYGNERVLRSWSRA